jgi:hypothetical protein
MIRRDTGALTLATTSVLIALSCGGGANDYETSAHGPSCSEGAPTGSQGGLGPGTSSGCATCIGELNPGFGTLGYCSMYWPCFCACESTDAECHRACGSLIDAPCALWWSHALYDAQHECSVGGDTMTSVGCKVQCAGQVLPVSVSELDRIESKLGGISAFVPTPCDAGAASD